MTVSTCVHCQTAEKFRSELPAYCAEHERSIGITFSHVISTRINPAELAAVDIAIREVLRVLEHGARDRNYNATFISDGYVHQIQRAHRHLRAEGRRDPGSGLREVKHALTRLTLAVGLLELEHDADAAELHL